MELENVDKFRDLYNKRDSVLCKIGNIEKFKTGLEDSVIRMELYTGNSKNIRTFLTKEEASFLLEMLLNKNKIALLQIEKELLSL